MINIAIVDDNRVDLNEEVQITEEYFRKKGLLCRVEPFEDPGLDDPGNQRGAV